MKVKLLLTSLLLSSFLAACQPEALNNPLAAGAEPVEVMASTEEDTETVIGTFSTAYNVDNADRASNVALAAKTINGVVVEAGKEFSYNDTLGPTTKKNGYKMAKIIIKGKESKGYGGGVCQVSSTLYNAVKAAGLEVVERHAHTKPVAYVAEGNDAATSYGSLDFRFENNSDGSVKIVSEAKDGTVTVSIVKV